ncbi:MAG TPA: DUF6441 family protein, partial [Candidatus Limnocylindria bacterium]|nr:DUF6441 family protein [Candidatus Limnocylindria bacterium]
MRLRSANPSNPRLLSHTWDEPPPQAHGHGVLHRDLITGCLGDEIALAWPFGRHGAWHATALCLPARGCEPARRRQRALSKRGKAVASIGRSKGLAVHQARRPATVPLFILVPQVTVRKRLDVGRRGAEMDRGAAAVGCAPL